MDMLTKKILAGAAVLVAAMLLVATPAVAQSVTIHANIRFEPAVDAVEELPETGRADYPTMVSLRITGENVVLVCPPDVQLAVEVQPVTHPDWAGMSLTPEDARTVIFDIPEGAHQGPEMYSNELAGPTANLAWDIENAPANHTHRYQITLADPQVAGDSADCAPSLASAGTDKGQGHLNVTYPYANTGDDEEVPCDQDPEQPKCKTETAGPEGGDSPGLGALLAVAAIVGAVLWRRRD